MITNAVASLSPLAADVLQGLAGPGQKRLSSQWLYDEVGSALFDAITHLAEYGLTRADERLLREHAGEIAALQRMPTTVVELGSGSGRKTRHVLDAMTARQGSTPYYPIDVSASALLSCTQQLAAVADVVPVHAEYLEGLRFAAEQRRPGHGILLLFLGSTIGNFEVQAAEDFLCDVRSILAPGDALLIGADLVKEICRMLAAYDDAAGVTAAFNRNILARINRELHADFDVRAFEHRARYDAEEQRVEMHLRAQTRQRVRVPEARVTLNFEAGETIWTESSRKFRLEELELMALSCGFTPRTWWVDAEWPFANCLWSV